MSSNQRVWTFQELPGEVYRLRGPLHFNAVSCTDFDDALRDCWALWHCSPSKVRASQTTWRQFIADAARCWQSFVWTGDFDMKIALYVNKYATPMNGDRVMVKAIVNNTIPEGEFVFTTELGQVQPVGVDHG